MNNGEITIEKLPATFCLKESKLSNPKVRDHCRYTGEYPGPAHTSCNLKYKIPHYIPIVFHNLSAYDAPLFNRFIRFMASSLDSLTNNLVKDNRVGEAGRKLTGFKDYSEAQYELLIRKGVYPYEYLSNWDKFKESKLPPKESFYSNLNMSDISDWDYSHVQKGWKGFGMKNVRKYRDLYLKTDVILISNIFEAFRSACLKHYNLDLAHFDMSPGLAWQACLKKTGIELELLTDPDMLLMFERGLRGGITQAVHRYAEANIKYMRDNPKEDSSYLQYLDASSLYGWAMIQKLPTGGFNWVDPSEFTPDKIDSDANWNNEGYLLEVDVRYPKELHDSHNDLSLYVKR